MRAFTRTAAVLAAALAIMGTATAAQASPRAAANPLPSCRNITYRGNAGYIAVQTSPAGYVV